MLVFSAADRARRTESDHPPYEKVSRVRRRQEAIRVRQSTKNGRRRLSRRALGSRVIGSAAGDYRRATPWSVLTVLLLAGDRTGKVAPAWSARWKRLFCRIRARGKISLSIAARPLPLLELCWRNWRCKILLIRAATRSDCTYWNRSRPDSPVWQSARTRRRQRNTSSRNAGLFCAFGCAA